MSKQILLFRSFGNDCVTGDVVVDDNVHSIIIAGKAIKAKA